MLCMGTLTYLLVRDAGSDRDAFHADPERERLLQEVRSITSRYGLPA